MTDPRRLLMGDGSEEERRLLSAAAAEEPPADGAKRMAVALGLSAAALGSTAPAKAAGKGVLGKLVGAKLAVKAMFVLGAGAALAVTLATRAPEPRSALPSTAPRAPAASEPQVSAPARDLATPSSEGQADVAQPSSIADEVARLDAVRTALFVHKPDAALDALDRYAQSYPRGTLQPEAARLRVEAWLAKGDARRARSLARAFLRAYPESPHAKLLRRIAQSQLESR